MHTREVATPSQQVVEKYVEKLCRVEVVSEILAADECVNALWIVIKAPPHDERSRFPVFQAEDEAMDETPGAPHPRLWVLNPAEYPGKNLSAVIPSFARRVWRR
ncbi:MAG: hypothetical protein HY673_22950 [Chloroflexi bacterium]|nr:hypothetical protein [Chloroflexota bacterium]